MRKSYIFLIAGVMLLLFVSMIYKGTAAESYKENLSMENYGKATFAGGCFWGVQDLFDMQKGVSRTFVGYTGGHTKKPSYKDVCTDTTGHAEAVEVYFNPKVITYKKLLDVFFRLHDPTTLNKQGPDTGSQYRSVIFYHNEVQKKAALDFIAELEKKKVFSSKIVTEVVPASEFYKAEEYHQKYFKKNGKSGCHVLRKSP